MAKNNLCYLIYFMLLILFFLQSIFYPNFILAEEHHYLEVASNMFYHHQGWLLQDAGGIYLSKPPLLFWMLSGLWFLFGAHAWVIHFFMLSILAGILFLTQYLYILLFDEPDQAKLTGVIVIGSFFFFSRSIVFCFDSLMVMFFLLSALGIVLALKHYYLRGFVLFGLGIGLGILTKGLIILGFCLPFFVVATIFRKKYHVQDRAWFAGFILSEIIVFSLAMIWLLPLINLLTFRQWYVLLLKRGAGVGYTYGHTSIYVYANYLFFLLLPWIAWPYGLRAFLRTIVFKNKEIAFQLIFYSLLLSLIVLSLIPPKEMRYIMPAVVLFALLYVRALFANKPLFQAKKDSTRNVLIFIVIVIFLIEIMSLFFPKKIMSYIIYPDITYSWLLFFESFIVIMGCVLIAFKKRSMVFEVMRLSGFVFVLILGIEVFPHEVLSSRFAYQGFVAYLQEVAKQGVPIVYCRNYMGYAYSMVTPPLPEKKYQLSAPEGQRYNDVYFVREVKSGWQEHKHYLYRLINPSQTAAIFIEKVNAREVVKLSPKQQRCNN